MIRDAKTLRELINRITEEARFFDWVRSDLRGSPPDPRTSKNYVQKNGYNLHGVWKEDLRPGWYILNRLSEAEREMIKSCTSSDFNHRIDAIHFLTDEEKRKLERLRYLENI